MPKAVGYILYYICIYIYIYIYVYMCVCIYFFDSHCGTVHLSMFGKMLPKEEGKVS